MVSPLTMKILLLILYLGLLFMMGNKIDEEREVSEDDADQLCESLGCKQHFLVSVKTGRYSLCNKANL